MMLKNPRHFIEAMRATGRLAAAVLEHIKPFVQPQISTDQLDAECHAFITQVQHAIPSCLGYKGFPKSVCISVNDVVCHGIPGPRVLKLGDIVNIDVTVYDQGVHGDTSMMFFVGQPSVGALRLCQATQEALYAAIAIVRPGLRLRELGRTIESVVARYGYGIVREFCGHFIGEVFHAPPSVLHYFAEDEGCILAPGMTFTIEPMINAGQRHVRIMKDGWTVKTKDRSLSAQYEHTLLVTDHGYEILTLREDEPIARASSP